MIKIGLVTNKDFPNLSYDDQLLYFHLRKLEYDVEPVIWNFENNWEKFDLLIIRSVWDYHLYPNEFQDWLGQISGKELKVMNSVQVVSKNIHKSYLIDFLNKGLPVIPTQMVSRNSSGELSDFIDPTFSSGIVIKPAVSLNSHDTYRIRKDEISKMEPVFKELTARHDLLIQPFVPEILREGELSLIFFNRKFSHSVRKLPAIKDFRVQTDFGGIAEPVDLPPQIINEAYKFLKEIEGTLLYARVDGIIIGNRFFLMELELIDPALFFTPFPESLKAFSRAIKEII